MPKRRSRKGEESEMIHNKNGEMFFYEDKMFIIGEEVYAIESTFYGFL